MLGLARATLSRAREERLAQAAGSLTLTTVLSAVPLLAVSFALFTRFPGLRDTGQAIRDHLMQGLLPAEISRTVLAHLGQFMANTRGLTLVGALFVAATALLMLLNVENVLNRIWRVRKPRPALPRLGLHLALLILAPTLLGASLWATAVLQSASAGWLVALPPAGLLALQAVPVLLGAIGFACLFYFVPHARVRRRDALAGGLLASLAFELGKRGFTLYLQQVPTVRTVYGAFAPVLLFLTWVYFSWLVTLGSALVAANLGPAGRTPPRRKG